MLDLLPQQGPVFLIEVDRIRPNPYQPRRDFDAEQLNELAQSIREFGVLQPIVVTKVESETESGTSVHYELIAGERRLQASRIAGIARIPSVIRRVAHDRERLELAIIENVQREDLSPIEAARAYARLQEEFKLTQREIAVKIGKSREVIANTIRLLNLPTKIQEALSRKNINESQARYLLMLDNIADQETVFAELLERSIPVSQLRARIQQIKNPLAVTTPEMAGITLQQNTVPTAFPPPSQDPELASLTYALEEFLGAKVLLRGKDNGEISISFFSAEELKNILSKIVPQGGG